MTTYENRANTIHSKAMLPNSKYFQTVELPRKSTVPSFSCCSEAVHHYPTRTGNHYSFCWRSGACYTETSGEQSSSELFTQPKPRRFLWLVIITCV